MSKPLYSWGRYPKHPQTATPCSWRSELPSVLESFREQPQESLPFGNGRSYGDSCLATSDRVIQTLSMDRFISADWSTGQIVVEAGVTLAQILEVVIPRGWFLPVTPGTQFATVGGAIANDVHGKNHHRRGTFANHTPRFGLLRSDTGAHVCSSLENPSLYAATIGGLGLTGIITWCEINLIPVNSSAIDSTKVRFDNLKEFFSLSEELDQQHEYSVAWIDCLAKGSSVGRGVFIVGDHAPYGELTTINKPKLNVPFTPFISPVTAPTLKCFNNTYWRAQPAKRTRKNIHYEPFFYPLDGILNWNRIYGRRGFQQFQCVIPESNAEAAIHELLSAIAKAGQGSFLAVLKRCGETPSPGLLSFPMPGTSLALDFSQRAELNSGLFKRLDQIVAESGGRLYPAKDAHMSGEHFRSFYPAWEQVETLRDPAFKSRFWKRVTT